jgi:predicted alpha/beta hydrolase family esterase
MNSGHQSGTADFPRTAGRVLIVPGYQGSGPAHWQSWFERHLPGTRRVGRIDWEAPVIANWVHEIRNEIACAAAPVWLIAHSFGCLAAVLAAAALPGRVAGAMLVAPADPARFSLLGLRPEHAPGPSLSLYMTRRPLPVPSLLVASASDPWMRLDGAASWAERWGSRFVNLGNAGHINVEAGFGPWPEGLELFASWSGREWRRDDGRRADVI